MGAIKSWMVTLIQPEMGGGMYPGGDLYDDDEEMKMTAAAVRG